MAAGLSLAEENIPALRKGLSEAIVSQVEDVFEESAVQIDGHLAWDDLSQDLVTDIGRLAPFGSGNPSLLFATKDLKIVNHRTLGRDKRHLLLTLENEVDVAQQVIWWRWDNAPLPEERFDLVYSMRINDFRGKQQLQIVWEDFRERMISKQIPVVSSPSLQIIDYRRELHPETLLKPLLDRDDVQIWCESVSENGVSGQNRCDLIPAPILVIWTSPPGPAVLQAVLSKVKPGKVYLFKNESNLDNVDAFLKHLTGLVKYALRASDGCINISEFAAMTAHREIVVRVGLTWLEARGYIHIISDVGGELCLEEGKQVHLESVAQLEAQLKDLLAETSAYRKHFALMNEQSFRILLQK
jgi:single-stranded-DNA-specific exonuclease